MTLLIIKLKTGKKKKTGGRIFVLFIMMLLNLMSKQGEIRAPIHDSFDKGEFGASGLGWLLETFLVLLAWFR